MFPDMYTKCNGIVGMLVFSGEQVPGTTQAVGFGAYIRCQRKYWISDGEPQVQDPGSKGEKAGVPAWMALARVGRGCRQAEESQAGLS